MQICVEVSLSIEGLVLLVVEREFDLEGKWQQEEEGNACLGDSGDDDNVGKEDEKKGKQEGEGNTCLGDDNL